MLKSGHGQRKAAGPAARPDPKDDPFAQVEREFLARVSAYHRPVRLADLFEGFEPTWARDAAERCVVQGLLLRDADGKFTLTKAGAESAAVGRAEQGAYVAAEMNAGRPLYRKRF